MGPRDLKVSSSRRNKSSKLVKSKKRFEIRGRLI
jgi:hypothetical protein